MEPVNQQQLNKYQVYGFITIPFYFPTWNKSKQEALDKVSLILNNKTITLIDGDIHTADGNSHPLIAPKCNVDLVEVIGEDDI